MRAYSSCFFKALPLTHFLATPPALCSGAMARADKAQMMEGGQEMCTALTTGMAKSLTTCASGDRECVLFIGKRGHQITVIIRNYTKLLSLSVTTPVRPIPPLEMLARSELYAHQGASSEIVASMRDLNSVTSTLQWIASQSLIVTLGPTLSLFFYPEGVN